MRFKSTAEDVERGTAVPCDGRLFHRGAAVTGNALSPTMDRRVRRTSRDVDEAERIVVWLECLIIIVFIKTLTDIPLLNKCTINQSINISYNSSMNHRYKTTKLKQSSVQYTVHKFTLV